MNLKDYLKSQKISVTKFAKKLDLDRTWLSRIVNGKTTPSLKVALQIEKVTHGKVTVHDLMASFEERKEKTH